MDGTKVAANASRHRNVRHDRAGELIEQLEADIAALMEEAEAADRQESEEGQRLPEVLSRREKLKEELERRFVGVLVAVSREGRRRHDFPPEVLEKAPTASMQYAG